MAGPITWRTVTGPSLADASRPLESAQRSIDKAFSGLSGVLKETEDTDSANWNQIKENNTQEFMSKLYSAQGAEGFKALQDSGELERMIAANGAQIDQAAVRAAMDSRLGTLQQRDKQGWEFANAALDQQESPVVNQVKSMLAQGNLEGAKPLIASLSPRGQANMFTALDATERQLVERARGDTEFGWKGAAESQNQQLRPLEVAAKNLSLENSRLQKQGQVTQNAVASLNLTDAQGRAADAKQVRNLENRLATAVQTRRQEVEANGQAMGIIAKNAGLSVDASGQPDFSNYTNSELDAFDAAASTNRQVKVPKARDFMSGDTVAANSFLKSLEQSGEFRPDLVQKFQNNIRQGFNSTSGTTPVGNDAFNQRLAAAQNQVLLEDTKANNMFVPGSPTARTAYKELADDAPNLIDKASGNSSEEDIGAIQDFIFEMSTRGVETKPGSGIFITPPISVVQNAIRSAKGGWFMDNARADEARKKVEDYLKTPGAQKLVAEAEGTAVLLRNQRVQSILNSTK